MYTVKVILETGAAFNWVGGADDKNHAEGLAIAFATEKYDCQVYSTFIEGQTMEYIEITKQAFDRLVSSEAVNTKVVNEELCNRVFYFEHGATLQAVTNYVEPVTQYYIRDINA